LETITKKLYEAMFLVDSALATDWDGIIKTIQEILKRSEAEVVSLRKWGERKLAYEIDHKSRGTYILCYFRADANRIKEIERTVQLSERIMRILILRVDKHRIPEVEKLTPEISTEDFSEDQEDTQAEQSVNALTTEEAELTVESAEPDQQDNPQQPFAAEDQERKQDSGQQPNQDNELIEDQ
jgi:small subunit ribosomal protein S6